MSSYESNTPAELGSFDFPVNPLYSGMFSFGFIKSDLVDPDYKIVNDGTNDLVSLGDESDHDYLHALMYTPFIWGKRDLEKPVPWFSKDVYKHINPTIGISLQDTDEHVFAGISVDFPMGVLFTYGRHYGKVSTLTSTSGLSVGDTFTGTLPTSTSWESEEFFALSFDLNVVKKLFSLQESSN